MIVQDTMEIYHHFTTAFEPISSHSSYTLHIHTYSTLHIHYIVISDVESNTQKTVTHSNIKVLNHSTSPDV